MTPNEDDENKQIMLWVMTRGWAVPFFLLGWVFGVIADLFSKGWHVGKYQKWKE